MPRTAFPLRLHRHLDVIEWVVSSNTMLGHGAKLMMALIVKPNILVIGVTANPLPQGTSRSLRSSH